MNASYAESVSVSNAMIPTVPANYARVAESVNYAETATVKTVRLTHVPEHSAPDAERVQTVEIVTVKIAMIPHVPAKSVRNATNAWYAETVNAVTAIPVDVPVRYVPGVKIAVFPAAVTIAYVVTQQAAPERFVKKIRTAEDASEVTPTVLMDHVAAVQSLLTPATPAQAHVLVLSAEIAANVQNAAYVAAVIKAPAPE